MILKRKKKLIVLGESFLIVLGLIMAISGANLKGTIALFFFANLIMFTLGRNLGEGMPYRKYWGSYFNFSGRSTRKEYWIAQWFVLLNLIMSYIVPAIVGGVMFNSQRGTLLPTWYLIVCSIILGAYILVNIIPQIRLNMRRLRDAGLPVPLTVLMIIYPISWIFFVIVGFIPSTKN